VQRKAYLCTFLCSNTDSALPHWNRRHRGCVSGYPISLYVFVHHSAASQGIEHSLSLTLSLSLSLSRTHTHTCTHKHTHTLAHTRAHTHTFSFTHTRTYGRSQAYKTGVDAKIMEGNADFAITADFASEVSFFVVQPC